tara:strand:+ start:44 stop:973 length:930 start_codon:yes stop_codon:yes gene_type:complete
MGEFDLIESIKEKIKHKSKDVVVGVGDDCAVLEFSSEEYMLVTTDSLVEGDHFNLDWSSPIQVGMKAVEQNVSDIAAMGGYPEFMLVSLGLPTNDSKFVDEFYKGLENNFGINIIGGNISHSKQIFVNITLIGKVEKNYLALRRNAKVGDLIYCSGDVGKSTTGLELLRAGLSGESVKFNLEPKCRLDLGRDLVRKGVKCMIDVSDGVGAEVRHICNASKVGARIYADKIPISSITKSDCLKLGKNYLDMALYGGEDYELVFTASKELDLSKYGVVVIGEIVNEGVKVVIGGEEEDIESGFDHFKRLNV